MAQESLHIILYMLDAILGQIQDLIKGGSDKCLLKVVAPTGVQGHAPPQNF